MTGKPGDDPGRVGRGNPLPRHPQGIHQRCPMRTVRIPVDAFMVANPALNLGNILRVKLQLTGRPTGHILADDIEIGR